MNSPRVLLCGDIMPGGVLPYQQSYISPCLSTYLKGFDIRVGTLECAIGTDIAPAAEKLSDNGGNNNVCFARDEDFFRVKELGIDAVSLGNNHSFDMGEEGLKNTIGHLKSNGIGYFGAGMNKAEASAPYVVQTGGRVIAFIGCCIKGLLPKSLIPASENSYGVYQPSIDELCKHIKSLKRKYEYLIIMPHWGEEHVLLPPVKCVEYARLMVDAGADGVFGSHSHCVSSSCFYKKKPICFGMGNFLYPDVCLTPPRPFYYPKSPDELKRMPKCLNYPKSVKKNTICVWGGDSRIGFLVEAIFDETIKTQIHLVRMSKNDVLSFYKDYSVIGSFLFGRIVLPILDTIPKMPFYGFLYKVSFRISRKVTCKFSDFRQNV